MPILGDLIKIFQTIFASREKREELREKYLFERNVDQRLIEIFRENDWAPMGFQQIADQLGVFPTEPDKVRHHLGRVNARRESGHGDEQIWSLPLKEGSGKGRIGLRLLVWILAVLIAAAILWEFGEGFWNYVECQIFGKTDIFGKADPLRYCS